MQKYKRKITYFYQYHNGTVGSTAGFMKLEIRGDKVKVIINIQEPIGLPYKAAQLYIYHEAGDHLAALKVDAIESINGVLTYQTKTDWQNVFQTDRDLYTFDGIAVVYNDSHYYIGDFADRDRRNYELVKREPKPTIANMVPVIEDDRPEERMPEGNRNVEQSDMEKARDDKLYDKPLVKERMADDEYGKQHGEPQADQSLQKVESKAAADMQKENLTADNIRVDPIMDELPEYKRFDDENKERKGKDLKDREVESKEKSTDDMTEEDRAFGSCANCPYQEKRREHQEDMDAFEKMIQTYPKLPMYGATELFDCVRIHPRDIGKLDMRNWKLGVNSFLTHGFYTYQYLLLGKLRFEDGSYRCIIGVPGVFSNREKYLANMFGFDQFIPVKKTGVKTGEFGYWIVEIVPCL